jgi:hypothetical protein
MTAPEAPAQVVRVVRAAAIYFAVVFIVGFMLGPIRVLWLEPWLGKTIAVLIEAPFLIAAMALASVWVPRWTGVNGGWVSYLTIGVAALAFQQIADLAVGFGLRGMTLNDQVAYFGSPPGYIYAATLIVFALMPLWMWSRRTRSEA